MANEQILVVEDTGFIAARLRKTLTSLGYTVPVVVASGEEAIQQTIEARPDLVLMDIELAGELDGIEAAEQIRARFDLPVIYLTAHAEDVFLQRAKLTEPYSYLIKPVQDKELHAAIEMALYRHKLEARLKERERWLDTTLRSIGEAVITTDDQGRVTFMNVVAEGLTGWKQADAVGHDLGEVFHVVDEATGDLAENPVTLVLSHGDAPQSEAKGRDTQTGIGVRPEPCPERIRKGSRGGGLADYTLLLKKEGTTVPIDHCAALMRAENGHITGVVLVFRDVTEQVRAGEALQKAHDELELRVRERTAELGKTNEALKEEIAERVRTEEALRQAEEKYRGIFESALEGIFQTTLTGQFITANPAMARILGYQSPEELITTVTDVRQGFYVEPERRAEFERLMEEHGIIQEFVSQIYRKDGRAIWVSEHARTVRDTGGKILYYEGILEDITERKRTEEALRESLQTSADIVQAIPAGLFIYQYEPPDRLILLSANPEAERLTGITAREWRGKEFDEIWPQARARGVTQAYLDVMKTGETFETEDLYYADERIEGAFRIRAFLMPAKRLGVAFENIIKRKQAEEALRESEEKYRALAEHSPNGIFISDAERFIYVNQCLCEITGFFRDELLNMSDPVGSLFAPEEREKVLAHAMSRLSGDPAPTGYEARGIRKDGEEVSLRLTVSSVVLLGRRVLQGTIEDVTERKQAEEEIRRRNRELALLNEVIAASAATPGVEPESILETTCRELALTFDVPQVAALLLNEDETEAVVVAKHLAKGWPSALGERVPVEGNPIAQHLLTHKAPLVVQDVQSDSRLASIGEFLRWRGAGSLLIVPLIIEEKVVGCLGLAPTELRDFPVEEVDLAWRVANQVAGVLARVRLNEERQRLEEQYFQAQKMEAVGRLAGGMAHDFNNLLTAMMGYAGLALRALPPYDPLRSDIEGIQETVERAANLTRQLLAFARKQLIHPTVLNLNDLILNVDKMLRRLIREDIELVTLPTSALGQVKADPGQLEQVLLNLAVNARDAMPNGGKLTIGTANVTLDEDYAGQHAEVTPGEYVLLSVSDTGLGMTDEVKAHIFEPFFTTKGRDKGTGLGLATCFGIVKQNGGHIEVYSEVDRGTTFKIYLPRLEEAVSLGPTQETPDDLPWGTETVLLVEDESLVRELALRTLRQQGYKVLEAANGDEALRVAREYAEEEIHLLLTDVVMPQLGGKELADRLQTIRPNIKVLFTSGYTDDAIVHHGVLEPGISFIQKPFSPEALARKVREVLDG